MRLFVGRHRRPLTLLVVLLAVWVTVRAAAPARPELGGVLVATRDLPAGRSIGAGDLRTARLPVDALPAGRLEAVPANAVLASPLRAGEPLTDARVLGPGLLAGSPPGTVAVPVRLSDPAATGLVEAGDRVDVLAGPAASGGTGGVGGVGAAVHLVLGARVLAVPHGEEARPASRFGVGDTPGSTDPAGVIVLAVTSAEAERLASAQPQSYLGVAVLPRT